MYRNKWETWFPCSERPNLINIPADGNKGIYISLFWLYNNSPQNFVAYNNHHLFSSESVVSYAGWAQLGGSYSFVWTHTCLCTQLLSELEGWLIPDCSSLLHVMLQQASSGLLTWRLKRCPREQTRIKICKPF